MKIQTQTLKKHFSCPIFTLKRTSARGGGGGAGDIFCMPEYISIWLWIVDKMRVNSRSQLVWMGYHRILWISLWISWPDFWVQITLSSIWFRILFPGYKLKEAALKLGFRLVGEEHNEACLDWNWPNLMPQPPTRAQMNKCSQREQRLRGHAHISIRIAKRTTRGGVSIVTNMTSRTRLQKVTPALSTYLPGLIIRILYVAKCSKYMIYCWTQENNVAIGLTLRFLVLIVRVDPTKSCCSTNFIFHWPEYISVVTQEELSSLNWSLLRHHKRCCSRIRNIGIQFSGKQVR